uniref:Anoctamin n=1 Tax=Macrostomum lignano TaxID=282301 RepID=A0A1I8JJM0_9PLAT
RNSNPELEQLFAASFPLAPLIALLTNLFDNATDAHRMLWNFRRPVAMMAQNIGMWHDIVEFLNVAGVISNACIIAFTASWVKLPQFEEMLNNLPAKLCIVLIVENVVLGLKYFISAVIPDVPSQVHLQMRRERYRVPKILNSGNINAISDGEESIASMVSLGSQLPSYVILRFYPNDGNMCVSFVF